MDGETIFSFGQFCHIAVLRIFSVGTFKQTVSELSYKENFENLV